MTVRPPRVLYVMKQVELATRARLEEIAKPFGVTALQYTALTVLDRQAAPISSAELARLSFVTAQTMADMVAALERRGLVARAPDPAHGRRLLITLTDQGEALLRAVEPGVAELEETLLDGFSVSERAGFSRILDRARRNLAAAGAAPGAPRDGS